MACRALLVFLVLGAAVAQDRPGAVIRIDVNLVQVDAVVTDAHGKHVADLKASDFEILQDGKPQTITNFSYHSLPAHTASTAAPSRGALSAPAAAVDPAAIRRTIVIVIDNLCMPFEDVVRSRNAARKFLDEQMQPGDLVAILRTNGGMGALQRFTTDPRLLRTALDRVNYNIMCRPEIAGTVALSTDPLAQLTQRRAELFSVGTIGSIRSVVTGMHEMPGRKSLILISENLAIFHSANWADPDSPSGAAPDNGGVIDGMAVALRRLVDAANRASVVIHTIDPRGLKADGAINVPGGNPGAPPASAQEFFAIANSRDGLEMLAQQTGGLFLANNNDINGLLQRAIDDYDGYYLLGYHPDSETFRSAADQFRKLKVRITRPGLQVRSRTGFFGAPESIDGEPARRPPSSAQSELVSALNSPFAASSIHVRLTPLFVASPTAGPSLNALLYIDTRDLEFGPEAQGARKASFDLLAVTYDARGETIANVNRHYTITAPANTLEQERNRGLLYTAALPLKTAGVHQVRVALRDAQSGNLGSATNVIETPDIKKGHLELSSLIVKEGSDIQSSAAVRTFRPGSVIEYGYQVLNAQTASAKPPDVESQIFILRDGRKILTGASKAIDTSGQTNSKQFGASGQLRLSDSIPPGDYVLQVVVTDRNAPEKFRTATQWIDFEVAR